MQIKLTQIKAVVKKRKKEKKKMIRVLFWS